MVWRSLHFPAIEDFDDTEWRQWNSKNDLLSLIPNLSLAALEDRPQNPILDSLLLSKANSELPIRGTPPRKYEKLPVTTKLGESSKTTTQAEDDPSQRNLDLWKSALDRKAGIKAGLRSWDRLRTSHSDRASSTAFLSEQEDGLYSAARSIVHPRLFDPNLIIVQTRGEKILWLLKHTVLGLSSTLFPWDPSSERFIQQGTGEEKRGIILVDGMDEVASGSYISRFLATGTLLRRLEILVESLRTRPAQEGPTIHAFAHALSSCLVYLRDALQLLPPTELNEDSGLTKMDLVAIWSQYESCHDILEKDIEPEAYEELKSSPVSLLTRIYDHLERSFDERSPLKTRAVLAFVMTASSQEYIQRVARAVGFGGRLRHDAVRVLKNTTDEYVDLDEEEHQEDIFALMDKVDERFPSFFPRPLRKMLPAAQRSLILLNIAQVEHPSLGDSQTISLRWVWTVEGILALWNQQHPPPAITDTSSADATLSLRSPYRPEFSLFDAFDMEPGTSDRKLALRVKDNSHQILTTFIGSFPEDLPPITPALPQVTAIIFHNLTRHARTLSSTLLAHFLDTDGILNFRSHLLILRSFLLLSAPSFKARLTAALLSDAGEYEVDNTPHSMSIRYFRRPRSRKHTESNQPWAVGISPNLLDREQWPPVGTDLSFFLRTVIVDALEEEQHHRHHYGRGDSDGQRKQRRDGDESVVEQQKDQVTEEASWRLGFAIRDLPVGTGKDKWLDPLAIEALDFLYMDYKPPHPLEILISPEVLSKYQRMFAFLLRLLRVECALKSVCRMTTHRTMDRFLFPTFSASRKLLLHFRFVAQSFVSALSSYVFDTVIGGNFDAFFARLSTQSQHTDPSHSSSEPTKRPEEDMLTSPETGSYQPPNQMEPQPEFADVFELEEAHSVLLDDILSACLLRSQQRALSDLLRQALATILDFAVLIGELYRERVKEYQAVPELEEKYARFRNKVSLLTKGLKNLTASVAAADSMAAGAQSTKVGGQDALYQLLIKLDFGDWWTAGIPKADL